MPPNPKPNKNTNHHPIPNTTPAQPLRRLISPVGEEEPLDADLKRNIELAWGSNHGANHGRSKSRTKGNRINRTWRGKKKDRPKSGGLFGEVEWAGGKIDKVDNEGGGGGGGGGGKGDGSGGIGGGREDGGDELGVEWRVYSARGWVMRRVWLGRWEEKVGRSSLGFEIFKSGLLGAGFGEGFGDPTPRYDEGKGEEGLPGVEGDRRSACVEGGDDAKRLRRASGSISTGGKRGSATGDVLEAIEKVEDESGDKKRRSGEEAQTGSTGVKHKGEPEVSAHARGRRGFNTVSMPVPAAMRPPQGACVGMYFEESDAEDSDNEKGKGRKENWKELAHFPLPPHEQLQTSASKKRVSWDGASTLQLPKLFDITASSPPLKANPAGLTETEQQKLGRIPKSRNGRPPQRTPSKPPRKVSTNPDLRSSISPDQHQHRSRSAHPRPRSHHLSPAPSSHSSEIEKEKRKRLPRQTIQSIGNVRKTFYPTEAQRDDVRHRRTASLTPNPPARPRNHSRSRSQGNVSAEVDGEGVDRLVWNRTPDEKRTLSLSSGVDVRPAGANRSSENRYCPVQLLQSYAQARVDAQSKNPEFQFPFEMTDERRVRPSLAPLLGGLGSLRARSESTLVLQRGGSENEEENVGGNKGGDGEELKRQCEARLNRVAKEAADETREKILKDRTNAGGREKLTGKGKVKGMPSKGDI